MATPAELTAAGVPKEIVAKVAAAAEKRADEVSRAREETDRLEQADGLEPV